MRHTTAELGDAARASPRSRRERDASSVSCVLKPRAAEPGPGSQPRRQWPGYTCAALTSSRSPLQIRPFEEADWPAVWALLEPVFRAGETFPHDPAISEAEAQVTWVDQSQAVMVAVNAAGAVVGTYYLRPNSLTLGAHVANAGYVVSEHCRRQGIGSRLCQHSLQAARRLGFRAMQFNLVVSTNTAGLRCWQRNGFQVVGTLPGAFRHRQLGFVDALVMIQGLVEGTQP
ncbi:MAG: GNAT family N-acetyltransferase [Cyanobacteria bacterium K_Offshore_surface_m2_011]|nr:GNAT family N-acetyltransferase [Cyanobacteria bacterium K_Offshore_surface_m2_011]